MDEAIDVKDIPLPGEEYNKQTTDNAETNPEFNIFESETKQHEIVDDLEKKIEDNVEFVSEDIQSINTDFTSVPEVITEELSSTVKILTDDVTPDQKTEESLNVYNEAGIDQTLLNDNVENPTIPETMDTSDICESVDDFDKKVENMLIDAVEVITEKESDPAVVEIEHQVESISINEEHISEDVAFGTNEFPINSQDPIVEKGDENEESDSKIADALVMETTDESFTLILNASEDETLSKVAEVPAQKSEVITIPDDLSSSSSTIILDHSEMIVDDNVQINFVAKNTENPENNKAESDKSDNTIKTENSVEIISETQSETQEINRIDVGKEVEKDKKIEVDKREEVDKKAEADPKIETNKNEETGKEAETVNNVIEIVDDQKKSAVIVIDDKVESISEQVESALNLTETETDNVKTTLAASEVIPEEIDTACSKPKTGDNRKKSDENIEHNLENIGDKTNLTEKRKVDDGKEEVAPNVIKRENITDKAKDTTDKANDTTDKSKESEEIIEQMEEMEASEATAETEAGDDNAKSKKIDVRNITSKEIKDELLPNVPCHVLGRNIDNPQEDLVSNGRTPPKPRLGVKVPYRHLMSQIVTKQDIANELIERAAKRNPDPDPPLGGDIFFAQKLTANLASKIAKKDLLPKSSELNNSSKSLILKAAAQSALLPTSKETISVSSISNNQPISDKSDLLAILEGDVEVDWTKEIQNRTNVSEQKNTEGDMPLVILAAENILTQGTQVQTTPPKVDAPPTKATAGRGRRTTKKVMDPEIEKIIALKQLEQFPKHSKSRHRKQNLREQVQTRESLAKEVEVPVVAQEESKKEKDDEAKKTEVVKDVKDKEEPLKKETESPVANKPAGKKKQGKNAKQAKADEKKADDDVPTLSAKKIVKTYSRKEALLEVPADVVKIIDPEAVTEALEKENAAKDKKVENANPETDNTKTAPSETDKQGKKPKRIMADKDINKPEVTLVSKRARVIKRKVIWDPDEVPLRKSVSPMKKSSDENELPKSPSKTKSNVKKEEKSDKEKPEEIKTAQKTEKKAEEKEEKKKQEKPIKKVTKLLKSKVLRLRKGGRFLMKKKPKPTKATKATNKDGKKSLAVIGKKKNLNVMKKKVKKLSELDRLLMDEGAVNMLYNIKQQSQGKKKSDVVSVDRAQKELINRTKLVKDVITLSSSQEDTPKALRKKEGPVQIILPHVPLRKKSRDSLRSSLQSPPPSPSFMYPRRAEASKIIRRHSSSFSSEGSETPRRLSIDQNAEKQKEEKVENKVEVVQEEKDTQETSTPAKRRRGIPIFVRKPEEKTYKGKKKLKPSSETQDKPTTKEKKVEVVKEKLTTAEKRKLSDEMSKNFSQQIPRKRTRSSVAAGDLVELEIKIAERPKGSPQKGSKKTDKFSELVKDKTQKETEKTRASSRQMAMANNYKEISVRKIDNLVQIILTPTTTKIKHAVNLQVIFATRCSKSCFTVGI